MKIVKTIIISILCLFAVQIIAFELIGKKAIHIKCMKELKTLAFDIDTVGIYSPYHTLTKSDKIEISRNLGENFKAIEFAETDTIYAEKYRLNKYGYGMSYEVESLNFLHAKTIEFCGTLEYGEVWESEYIWALFVWIKLRQENIGQS